MAENSAQLAIQYRMEQCIYQSPSGGTIPYCRRLINPELPGKTPVLLFLHGAGERGEDNHKPLLWCCPEVISWCERNHQKLLFLVPQCPPEQQWVNTPWQNLSHTMPEISRPMTLALEMLDMEIARAGADTDRLYISGISMGGYGTWDAVSRFPEKFAAAFPICGGADIALAPKLAKLPLRFYHGDADAAVPVSRSRDMAAALRAAGSQVFTYTELPGCGHNSWTPAFGNDDNLAWLFAQKRQQKAE